MVSPTAPVITNQRSPPDIDVIPNGLNSVENSVTVPAVVIVPTFFAADSVNQRLLSGPTVIELGPAFAVLTGYS